MLEMYTTTANLYLNGESTTYDGEAVTVQTVYFVSGSRFTPLLLSSTPSTFVLRMSKYCGGALPRATRSDSHLV